MRSKILGNFFFTTPMGDSLIISVPYIYNNFELAVPLVFFKHFECRNYKNKLKFLDILQFLLNCFQVNVYIITRPESIKYLNSLKNERLSIKVDKNIHAKILINSNHIILTSANLFYKSIYINHEFIEIKINYWKNPFKALKNYLPNLYYSIY